MRGGRGPSVLPASCDGGSALLFVRLVLAFGIFGATFVVAQVLLLRESVLLARGNELSIGILFGNWILAAGLGSVLAGRSAHRLGRARDIYVLLQVALCALLPVSILAARTSRHWLGLPPWETLGFGRFAWVTFLFVAPLAFVSGAMYAIGCRMLEEADPAGSDRAPARVYALESAGAVVGAVALSFLLLGRMKPLGIALAVGLLNLASALTLVWANPGYGRTRLCPQSGCGKALGAVAACLLVVAFLLLVTPGARLLEDRAWRIRWKPFRPIESVDSIYGNVSVVSLGEQVVFYENGIPSLTVPFPDAAGLEESVHIPLLAHPAPREALFLGGGLGGALAEALKHPLDRVTYAEIDPALVRIAERHGGRLVRAELQEPRARIVYEDGRAFLLQSAQRFDVIFLRVPEASTVQTNRYFTREFFERVREHLEAGGVFCFSMPGSEARLSEALAQVNRCAEKTLREVFPSVRILPGERNLFLAFTGHAADVTAEGLEKMRIERGIETRWLGPDSIRYRLDLDREAWLRRELEGVPQAATNLDLKPSLVRYFLWHHYGESSAGAGRWPSAVRHLGPAGVASAFGAVALLPIVRVRCRGKARNFALSYAIFTTGAVAMALEMAALLLFQSLYGYVYQWLGILIAAFMAGLAGGSIAAVRWVREGLGVYRRVLWLEGLLLGFVFLSALGLAGFSIPLAQDGIPAWSFKPALVGLMIAAGFLAGAEYPLAVRGAWKARPAGRGQTAEAGRLYALDLAGAFAGTLLLGVVLVPWIGIPGTLGACAVWKAASFGCLWLSGFDR